jgi:hypothetical protein
MIPNPTNDHWLKNTGSKPSWRITRMTEAFQRKMKKLCEVKGFGLNPQFKAISQHWEIISKLDCTDDANLSIQCREAIHDALDDRTEYLLSIKQIEVMSVLVAHITRVVDVLVDPRSILNTLGLANQEGSSHKEESLLTCYFNEIRPHVCDFEAKIPKLEIIVTDPHGLPPRDRDMDTPPMLLDENEAELRNTIWISLIFRMLCWLLLHDFDKADIKIVPSDLKGSRMPVFIG